MDKTKMAVLRAVEEKLMGKLTADQISMVSDAITQALAPYDVMEGCRELVVYDDANEKLLKQYCACLFVDGKSEKTIRQYRRACRKLADAIGKPFTEMGVYDIRYYLACEKDRGVSGRSAENTRAYLSAFFQWMTREDIIPKNPCMNIKPLKYTDQVRLPFSSVEIDALRSACQTKKERALIELLLASGIRVSEAVGLSVGDIDTTQMIVHVRHGKGDKERITYLTPVAMTHITAYWTERPEKGTSAFYNNQHKPLNDGGIRFVLNSIAKRAGVENVHPHRFRRTFASGLAARGMDIQEIQKLMGHSKIDTTLEYVYTSGRKVAESYRKYIA